MRSVISLLSREVARTGEALGAKIGVIGGHTQALADDLSSLHASIEAIQDDVGRLPIVLRSRAVVSDLSGVDAQLLNHAESHAGFRAQAGLWFNPPDVVRYSEGEIALSTITERSLEIPFVLAAVASIPHGGKVLDVGCAESMLALYLASIGYRVTGIDLHEYPLSHPNLESVASPLEDWATDESFDAVVCLSSIEHFGLGAYGEGVNEDRLDLRAMEILRERMADGGLLVVTVPFGKASVDAVQRTYDEAGLEELLDGWDVESVRFGAPAGDGWSITSSPPDAKPDERRTTGVALVTARQPG